MRTSGYLYCSLIYLPSTLPNTKSTNMSSSSSSVPTNDKWSAKGQTPYYKTAKPTARITSVESKTAPGCRMKKTKHQRNFEKLQHMMKQTDTTNLTDAEAKDWDKSMAHVAKILDPPYRGEYDMELLKELFYNDKEIFPFLETPKVKDLLYLQLAMEPYPDKEFDEARGKFENETKADIKRRYTPVIQKIIQFPFTSPLAL